MVPELRVPQPYVAGALGSFAAADLMTEKVSGARDRLCGSTDRCASILATTHPSIAPVSAVCCGSWWSEDKCCPSGDHPANSVSVASRAETFTCVSAA